jgi:hypothetical protein
MIPCAGIRGVWLVRLANTLLKLTETYTCPYQKEEAILSFGAIDGAKSTIRFFGCKKKRIHIKDGAELQA